MKRNFKIASIFIVFIGVILYFINWYFTPKPNYFDTYEGPLYYEQLNVDENKFIDSLRSIGFFSIEIAKPIVGLQHGYGANNYQVYLKTESLWNKDSLGIFTDTMAKHLYSNIISNFFIYDINSLYIEYNICPNASDENCTTKYFEYSKDYLEKWCGFVVKKVGEDRFQRVPHQ